MTWFREFSKKISEIVPVGMNSDTLDKLSALNPESFEVETVRSILGISSTRAKLICDTAVRRGVFSRRIVVLCPDGTVAASAGSVEVLPAQVRCWKERNGDLEEEYLPTTGLRTLEVFGLNA